MFPEPELPGSKASNRAWGISCSKRKNPRPCRPALLWTQGLESRRRSLEIWPKAGQGLIGRQVKLAISSLGKSKSSITRALRQLWYSYSSMVQACLKTSPHIKWGQHDLRTTVFRAECPSLCSHSFLTKALPGKLKSCKTSVARNYRLGGLKPWRSLVSALEVRRMRWVCWQDMSPSVVFSLVSS